MKKIYYLSVPLALHEYVPFIWQEQLSNAGAEPTPSPAQLVNGPALTPLCFVVKFAKLTSSTYW